MESHGENTNIRRAVLRGGKTIEIACVGPRQDLHLCLECASDLVYPVGWEETEAKKWSVLLRCPNCEASREGVFEQGTLERFEELMERGTDDLVRAYKNLTRANMSDESDRFGAALHADAILPEDF
jgi:hypothetical protein